MFAALKAHTVPRGGGGGGSAVATAAVHGEDSAVECSGSTVTKWCREEQMQFIITAEGGDNNGLFWLVLHCGIVLFIRDKNCG